MTTAAERAARRLHDLATVIVPRVRATFETHAGLRSALFVVAQYWADEAHDHVHAEIVFSKREMPRWPHECAVRRDADETGPDGDRCSFCLGAGEAYFRFTYEEATFRAWESYCHDYAHQEMELGEAYLPYCVLRRGPDDTIAIEVVGERAQAWKDAPDELEEPIASGPMSDPLAMVHERPDDDDARRVLADRLLERGDPRGEYLAIVLAETPSPEARARADALLAAHGRRWLGPLARVVAEGDARFVNGFPERVAAHFPWDEDLSSVFDAHEWATVRELTYLQHGRQVVTATMSNLRSLGPVGRSGLAEISSGRSTWSIERLHARSDSNDGAVLDALLDPDLVDRLPRLRALVLSGYVESADRLSALLRSPLARRLEAFHVALRRGPSSETLIHAADLGCWLDAPLETPPEIAFGGVGPAGEQAGPWLHLRRPRAAWIQNVGIVTNVGFDRMCRSIAELSRDLRAAIGVVAIRPTRWFDPDDDDVAKLEAAGVRARIERT